MIQITDYPQLEAILWDQKGRTEISDKEAFTYYESRWRYLDEDQFTESERAYTPANCRAGKRPLSTGSLM